MLASATGSLVAEIILTACLAVFLASSLILLVRWACKSRIDKGE